MNAAAYYRSVKQDREAWRDSMSNCCMICGAINVWPALQIHEICPRSAAPNRWWHRCNALLLCQQDHDNIWSKSDAEQLAIKAVCDPVHFDLVAWLRIGDQELRAPDRVTWSDVAAHLQVRKAVA